MVCHKPQHAAASGELPVTRLLKSLSFEFPLLDLSASLSLSERREKHKKMLNCLPPETHFKVPQLVDSVLSFSAEKWDF